MNAGCQPPAVTEAGGRNTGCRLWAPGHCSNRTRGLLVPVLAGKDGALFIAEDGGLTLQPKVVNNGGKQQ